MDVKLQFIAHNVDPLGRNATDLCINHQLSLAETPFAFSRSAALL